MARPQYESQADVSREASVADILASACKCGISKLPRLYSCDYAANAADQEPMVEVPLSEFRRVA